MQLTMPPSLLLNCTLGEASAWVDAVAFSGNGRFFATASMDNSVRVYEVTRNDRSRRLLAPPRLKHTLPDSPEAALAVAFSPSGRWLGSGSWDGKVRVYDLHDSRGRGGGPKLKHTLADAAFVVHSMAFSGDGLWLAAGSWDQSVRLYSAARPHRFELAFTWADHPEIVSCVAFSSDSSLLATASGSLVQLFSSGSGGIQRVASPRHSIQDTHASVSSLAFSVDGRWLAIGSHDTNVRLYDMASGASPQRRFTLEDAGDEISSLAFSPNSKFLASGSSDSNARLYDLSLASAEQIEGLAYEQDVGSNVMAVAFSADSLRLAVGSSDHIVHLYNVGAVNPPHQEPDHHKASPAPYMWTFVIASLVFMCWALRLRRTQPGLLPTARGDGALEMAHSSPGDEGYVRRHA